VNIGAPWPTMQDADARVLRMQTKLHQWARDDRARRFDDLFNLVCDPAFLAVAWRRVRGNKGKRSGGVDGVAPIEVIDVAGLLEELREDLKAQRFTPLPARERMIPKAGGKLRRLGIATTRDRVAQAALKLVLEPIFEADFHRAPTGSARNGVRRMRLPRFTSSLPAPMSGCWKATSKPVSTTSTIRPSWTGCVVASGTSGCSRW
jgi:RNA-directed DNA polymerase